MKPFFSILVPCCDVAPYVRECLESVKGQSFADWECLVVVETSTDNTEALVREVISGDRRFQVFTQPRSGSPTAKRLPSRSPQYRSRPCVGAKYVIFLDGDDYIAAESLRKLHDKITAFPNADCYVGGINSYGNNGDFLGSKDCFSSYDALRELSGHDATLFLFHPTRGRYSRLNNMAQPNIYSLAFLKSRKLFFSQA